MERKILQFFVFAFCKEDMLLRRVRIAAKSANYFDHICPSHRSPLDGFTSDMIVVISLKSVEKLYFRLKSGRKYRTFCTKTYARFIIAEDVNMLRERFTVLRYGYVTYFDIMTQQ